MSATESGTTILRRMLDECGVEWMDDSYAQLWCTVWHGQDGKQWRMTENQSGMLTELKAWKATPEQAIAATLGTGTCHNEGDQSDFLCSECGARMFTDTGETYTMIDSLGNIIEQPNYCPNCGRKVVDE